MKATKFTLAASVALATMIATGASASADVTLKGQNGEEVVSTEAETFAEEDEDANADEEDTSKDEEEDTSKDEEESDTEGIQTFFVDTKGKEIADPEDGIVEAQTIKGYVLIGSEIDEDGNLSYIFSGETTVNFTAQFNDSRADAKFAWTFPANTKVTYGELFKLAGLDPEDFDLGDYDFNGQTGSGDNATAVASNARSVEATLFDSNIDPDAAIDTGDAGSQTDLTVKEKEGASSDSSSAPQSSNNNSDAPAPTLPNTGEAEEAGLAIAGLSLMGATIALAATRRRF